ncbi:tRNA (cytidine/uridine-2'-O-)-methyltransferase [Arcanobacterium wilhelmae]|uniref:Putative tRNA (cytidine(34)-2'-O)-methyltransferase n=1 Tax=Arcanobacterium wilhelmae TaxID=1803177 RepID=A0ABT9N9R7_9ACTO|nr:tRNA (cytidine(34)-2'-O)-methyltransferase [Arcanobacterium wilhelmae]MDP9799956.1 tRNA (cytidine/uridine-2'-O-)-methyltransferase [Arcanobacterium wilhelmae]WFN91090.1 tRNA (cytidine(34)-2'-O)-methyltransferase [Arcanobacterium wilhelmae]
MLHFIFHEPKIPGNTGNAIRLAACTGARLHLVEPLAFDFSDTHLKRAGLDYHDLADVVIHPNWEETKQYFGDEARIFAFTSHTDNNFASVSYRDDDVLLFGSEPTGLPQSVLDDARITSLLRIPMLEGRRSLNLANSASIAVYEAWRQLGYQGSALFGN